MTEIATVERELVQLNLGGGRDVRDGWHHVDSATCIDTLLAAGAPADFLSAAELDAPDVRLPYEDDTFDLVEASHVLEHIHNLLPLVQEVWRVTKPAGQFQVAVPFGSSDDADEDPTHVRRFFPGSWIYFAQPTYWKSDYGYRGDFKPVASLLYIDALRYPAGEVQQAQVIEDVISKRNVVHEMRVVLEAQKPARSWTDAGGMDRWETRVVFIDVPSSDEAREKRVEQQGDLWVP